MWPWRRYLCIINCCFFGCGSNSSSYFGTIPFNDRQRPGFVSYVGMRRTSGGTDTLHGENQRKISPYPELRGTEKEVQEGRFGKVFIDGPMDAKTACDKHSGEIKGLSSPVVGNADILIFPNIESGNTFYKTLSLFGDANMAGMLTGTIAPVVVPSRSDSGNSKYYSLVLACLAGTRKE